MQGAAPRRSARRISCYVPPRVFYPLNFTPSAGASADVEEVYMFPGYYTVHFAMSDGDMHMISTVIFHKWHGKHLQ